MENTLQSAVEQFKQQERASRSVNAVAVTHLKVKGIVFDEAVQKIEELIDSCKAIISQNPIYNSATKENRKWAGKQSMYGHKVIQKLHELFTGIQRASDVHKTMLLAETNFSLNLIDTALVAFGRPATFYNNLVLDEVECDLSTLNTVLDIVEEQLDVVIERHSIHPAVVRNTFSLCRDRAEQARLDAEKTALERAQSPLTI